ncbi:tripartite motif-containing protein 16-like isoform X2 [Erpetoichthys calabaricus]|uniref:tripartite motif-containing protein 16-like isoform X2 n=1 Tax=Erpetoichthys calabaricus TaxID=27687 RepID=UPI00223406D1|nr:tripartite motif-containing protein 16-like isoform X2 [Erpetoichthys calabaricus]
MDAGDSTSQSNMGPGSVLCDVCPGPEQSAVKTCLTCMASYCETHLQPHRVSEALKTHKLKEPIRNLHERICTRHQRVLEIFCRTDETCICSMCVATEHKSHDTVTPEEERAERQGDLENTKAEMRRRIEEKQNKLVEMNEKAERIRSTAETELQDFEETFVSLLILRSIGLDLIREHENRELHKAEQLMMRLEKEIRKLRRTHAELAELSETNDHIHFLRMYSSVSLPPEDQDSPEASVNELVLPETLRMNLSRLKRKLWEISEWEFVPSSDTGVNTSGSSPQDLSSRNGLRQYFCPLTLDPNTANAWLHLSERNKKVIFQGMVSPCPDHPDRFDWWFQVLSQEALSRTRCYWEVEWSGEGAAMGVTYKGIRRQGDGHECRLGFNDQSWILSCSHFSCSLWHSETKTEISVPPSQRIGLHLDYSAGSLSFYSISDTMTLIHRFNATFTEPLYAGFWVGQNSSVTICPL